ncbi:MAG: tetratricopeptide repeat protein [Prevotella sp.]|nr:tetratricopeptide repeat protein [Prevotella sp.]
MSENDKYFESDEFKEIFKRYEAARKRGESPYFDPEELTDIAEYYYMLGNMPSAIEAADQAVRMFPGAAEPLAFRARMALHADNDTRLAKKLIDQIDDETHPEYHYVVAELMIFSKQYDQAEAFLEEQFEAIDDEEEREDFIIDVAMLYADYELYEKAAKWLHQYTDTDDPDYKELRGRIAMHRGNYEESERIFNELIDSDPYSTPYWNHLASAQFMHNNIRDSIQSSEFSIAINPNNADAILNKANGLFSLGNFKEARKFYKRFCELCPQEESGEMFQGICELNMDHLEKGIEHLKKAEEIAPENSTNLFEIYQELAFSLSRLGHSEEALAYAEKMLNAPTGAHDEALVMKAHLLMEAKQWVEAQACYSQAIIESGGSAHIFLRVAISIYDLGYYDHAYRLFRMLGKLDGDDERTEGFAYEALCCYSLGKEKEFREAVKKACERNPREAAIVLCDLFPEEVEPKDYYQYLINN